MRQDALQNRERIMAAAEAVFGERGAAGSTEDVARQAGVGIATVFRHFPSKEALIEATLLRHFAHLTERARSLAERPDPAAALRTLVRILIKSGATKLTLASLLADQREFPPSVGAASKALQAAVDDVLRRAQRSGAVRPSVGVSELYLLIRALSQASATSPASPDTMQRAIDIVLTGIAAQG